MSKLLVSVTAKAPSHMVEKAIDQQQLQSEFIDEALNHAYRAAVTEAKVRPVLPPKVSLTKFVPFSTLEFTADVEVLGKIVLADYKKLKITRPKAKVEAPEVDKVIANMRRQMATKTDVERPAKNEDEVWIDFVGSDEKGKPVKVLTAKITRYFLVAKRSSQVLKMNCLAKKRAMKRPLH